MKQNSSSRRVNEQARQIIAEILMFEISDPRLSDITITGCEVSFDRTFCNVFYTTDPEKYDEAQNGLERAAGKIRSEMAHKLSWRVAPELRFHLDKSVDQAQRIAQALADDAYRMPKEEDALTNEPEGPDENENTESEGSSN